jgi:uncharacterized protein involved in exopolysaccharide biosynthesis/Mrp family chromosome partitioning ATPase
MQGPQKHREIRTVGQSPLSAREPLASEGTALTLGDIYFTLFRHKFKIVLCSLLGVAAALAFYKTSPRIYESEAKLFIRYVMESRTPGRGADDTSVKSPDPGGQTILSSELEIITSLDLVGKVVDAIGVEKFIPHPAKDGRDRDRAIILVSESFQAQIPPRSSVVQMSFSSTNAAIVQPVLQEFINFYLKKHVEIHRSSGLVDDFLTQETEQLRSRLSQTEEDLRKAKSKLGFPSVEDAKKTLTTLSSRLRQDIFEAETELAERTAFLATIAPSSKPDGTEMPTPPTALPDDVVVSYGSMTARIEFLRKTEQELLGQFTPENSRVKETHAQLAEALEAKKKLEDDYPSLSILRSSPNIATSNNPKTPTTDLVVESARIRALQSKINSLNEQLVKLKNETSSVDQMEGEIVELNRKKELEETNYRKYAASLEQGRLDEAMSSGHVSNISEIQSPSLPLKAKSKRLQIVLGLAVGGLAIGLGLAFAIELFFDKTIKRPKEIEQRLNLPLFLSIPVVDKAFTRRLQQNQGPGGKTDGNQQLAVKDSAASERLSHALQQYHATLRDRLLQFFDNQNLTHKPKMVAVTGLSNHAGVTTTAAGLAQSLSETGDGNVLLVDMTAEQGSAQHYIKGKAVSSLEETLQTKDRALVQENLYVVTEGSNSDRLSRNLPQRFTKLVPKLKASDFDYIIFDMPPVSQISVTPRLAGFMDMMLLVVESEKTTPEAVEKGSALLSQSGVHVGVVLNKAQAYVPKFLQTDSMDEA